MESVLRVLSATTRVATSRRWIVPFEQTCSSESQEPSIACFCFFFRGFRELQGDAAAVLSDELLSSSVCHDDTEESSRAASMSLCDRSFTKNRRDACTMVQRRLGSTRVGSLSSSRNFPLSVATLLHLGPITGRFAVAHLRMDFGSTFGDLFLRWALRPVLPSWLLCDYQALWQ